MFHFFNHQTWQVLAGGGAGFACAAGFAHRLKGDIGFIASGITTGRRRTDRAQSADQMLHVIRQFMEHLQCEHRALINAFTAEAAHVRQQLQLVAQNVAFLQADQNE